MNSNTENHSRRESGQALLLIVVAVIGMIGLAALAIDGGMLLAERRAAQNAADSAAISAAKAICQEKNGTQAAVAIAAANGYTNGKNITIEVNTPPKSGPYAGQASHTEVIITTTTEPIFSGVVSTTGIKETVRAVAKCESSSSPSAGTKGPALGGEVAILALNPSAADAILNVGSADVIVDGGVYVNSNMNDNQGGNKKYAFNQTGSAVMLMNWAKIRGGAHLQGGFGNYEEGGGTVPEAIYVAGNVDTAGNGNASSGAFYIGGNVTHGASMKISGKPLEIGGNLLMNGAGAVEASDHFTVAGNFANTAGAVVNSSAKPVNMTVGGNVTGSGNAQFWGNMNIKGSVALSGSAKINGNVIQEAAASSNSFSGTGAINGTRTSGSVAKPTVSVTVPLMPDPFATILQPPPPPTTSCLSTSDSLTNGIWMQPNWKKWSEPQTLKMSSGAYYCALNISGSKQNPITIPPGTYWVNSFSISGDTYVIMDNVNLYILGKTDDGADLSANSSAFDVGGSCEIHMENTMLYLRRGKFSLSGNAGARVWTAPSTGPYQGLALFMDRANTSLVEQNGSTTLSEQGGTWYAPASKCSFTGNTSTVVYNQFICDTVQVTGSSRLIIKYDSTKVYQTETPGTAGEPSVSLMQ